MFAQDRGWLARLDEAIASGLTAEGAVQKVQNDTRARMSQVVDPYLRERLADLDELADRLLRHLAGAVAAVPLPEKAVVIARTLGPAELLEYDRKHLQGLVLEEGSPTAHVAIVARALDLPVIGRVEGALARIESRDRIIVDADNGQAFVRPGEDIEEKVADSMALRARRRAVFASVRDLPSVSRDGVAVSLSINAGLLIDMQHLAASGADGVGLYRTEIAFMVRDRFPDVGQQTEFYRRIYEQAAGKPVIFRTLDVGGDKVLPYWPRAGEENPAMGWRALRIGLDLPNLLRQQVRALIAAAAGRPLDLMFPMIATADEFTAARRIVDIEVERARQREIPVPEPLRVGAMLEVPSLHLAAAGPSGRGRFRLGRQQRPRPVPLRQRPRQSAPGRPLRPAGPGHAAGPQRSGAAMRRGGPPALGLRRDGEQADRGHGAAGPGHRAPLHVPLGHRTGETHDAQPGSRPLAQLHRGDVASAACQHPPRAGSLCARSWRDTLGALWNLGIARRDCYRRPGFGRKLLAL